MLAKKAVRMSNITEQTNWIETSMNLNNTKTET